MRVSWLTLWSADGLALAGLAAFFVLLGAIDLDLGPSDARLGLAAGERFGPLGQVVGYWAADLWPAEVLPSFLLAQLEPGGRPSSAAVRWPAALAAVLVGFMLSRRMMSVMGRRAGLLLGVCWFGSIALIDRSGAIGVDLIVGFATLAALDRLMTSGAGWVAGLWSSLAFLSGGLPPLIVIALAIVVIGRKQALPSLPLVIPPLLTVILWTLWTSAAVSSEALRDGTGLTVHSEAGVVPRSGRTRHRAAFQSLRRALPFSVRPGRGRVRGSNVVGRMVPDRHC